MKLKTAIEYFYEWEEKTPNRVFLKQPSGKTWASFTYAEVGLEARKMAAALQALGLKQGDHIGIYSKNCYHWIITDLAIMMGGFVSVPFFASLPKEQLAEVVLKSDLKALFVGKLDHWEDRATALPDSVQLIKFPHYANNAVVKEGLDWNDLVEKHAPVTHNFIPDLKDVWTILFTSGTTGSPKGAMLPHNSAAIILHDELHNNELGIRTLKEHQLLSFLPLNHVGERIGIEMLCLLVGGTMSFVESINTFAQNLQDTQPTFFFAVPRIWTKMQKGVVEKIPEKLLNILLHVPFFKKTLLKKMGFGRLQITLTGAAVTPEYLKAWYQKLGINLREVYGMTEGCGSVTLTPLGEISKNNVGKPLKAFRVHIDEETGEVLYRSRQQMIGYYKEPEKTAEILRGEWIHSGDMGAWDEQGNLKIIGRVKDAFKTSKGKFITPTTIEDEFIKIPLIEQVCIVGLGIDQPLALVNLTEAYATTDKTSLEADLKQALDAINAELINHEKVSTIVITKDTWSERNQLLTPTLKTRRGKLDEKYSNKYQAWHENKKAIIWET